MNAVPLRLVVATVVLSLLGAGCVNTPPPPPARTSGARSSTRAAKAVSCVGIRESTRRQREVAQAAARRVYFANHGSNRHHRPGGGSRFIAVKTESTTESTGEATCMIFDRASGNLVNSLVYDCSRVPDVGMTVKFASYNATYVGG